MKILDHWKSEATLNNQEYKKLYKESIEENEKFWNRQGDRIKWKKRYSKIKDVKYSSNDVNIKWFYDGILNVTESCI